jgi:vancomycin resistance protein YoaR
VPESYDHPSQTDQATDRMRVGPTPEHTNTEKTSTSETGSGGSDATPDSVEQTIQISGGPLAFPDAEPAHTERIRREPVETATERTERLAAVPAASSFAQPETQRTRSIASPPTATWSQGEEPAQPPAAPQSDSGGVWWTDRSRLRRAGMVAGIAAGVLALLYIGDLALSSGKVPRGTVISDIAIGGMDKAAAERKLRDELGPGLHEPITLTSGGGRASLNPDQAGLSMDWAATVERAGSQPLNPFTRLTSLFTSTEINPVSRGDRAQLTRALEQVKSGLERAPAEGTIRFQGAKPIAVEPVTGRAITLSAATDAVLSGWGGKKPVEVPFTEQPVRTTSAGVHKALTEVAEPAVSAPVTVRGDRKDAVLTPEAVASALRFEPDGSGGLKSHVDLPSAVAALQPQLADTMQPGQDAQVVLEGGAPVVHPSVDGRGIDWNKSFERISDLLKQRGPRSVQALYVSQPAKFTTDQANRLGIREVVSEFATGGFEPASGVNIRRVAEQVNGAIVKPGETFSLNGHTGPRGIPQGYVESGVIEDGRPARAVGGGISQFATTLYNASYFAGMTDVEHKEHSYYISRYPAGREATVFQNPDGSSVIDVKFKNISNSGIMITTQWTPSSITVRFWSTKQYEVTSQTSPRTNPTPPQEKVVPPGQPCSPSEGQPGFTVYDTRTIRNLATGQVTTDPPQQTKYDPHPIIHCGPPPPPPA